MGWGSVLMGCMKGLGKPTKFCSLSLSLLFHVLGIFSILVFMSLEKEIVPAIHPY
jgi:hypothetical protein